jgi:hypothetical protein
MAPETTQLRLARLILNVEDPRNVARLYERPRRRGEGCCKDAKGEITNQLAQGRDVGLSVDSAEIHVGGVFQVAISSKVG